MSFKLSKDAKRALRAFLIPKMKSMGESEWAYWSMDQDGWEEDLADCLDPVELILAYWSFEEEGSFPSADVGYYFDELEMEVFGHTVCG